ncbi:hypothetical protein, partial [Pseudoalteromonas sp. XI10]|uniref:hypothetical protein n=1 Tax=Pseudoalteromonas sp. XI10 TaxID=1766621 RepID=UPI000B04DE2C
MKYSTLLCGLLPTFLCLSTSVFALEDVDHNDDGIVDQNHYKTNLLSNSSFIGNENWTQSGLEQPTHTNRNGITEQMLATSYSYSAQSGYAE